MLRDALVITISDSAAAGKRQDLSGPEAKKILEDAGFTVKAVDVLPDERAAIEARLRRASEEGFTLVVTSGGTGLSPRDVTPEAIRPLLSREIPGVMEAARNYGQQRMPYAMLSRGVAGFIKNTLVLTLPGSSQGATETMDALFPYILHVFQVAQGMQH